MSDISAAFTSWNNVQSITPFSEATGSVPYMINIADGTLGVDTYGETFVYSWAGDPPSVPTSACYLHYDLDCPSMCGNNSKQMVANVTLDNSKMSSGLFSRNAHFLTEFTTAHEIGHVIGIDDYTGSVDCASTDTTIMSATEGLQCDFTGPQGCDATYETSRYSGVTVYPWASCGPDGCSTNLCSN